ncbi:MAG: DNA-protecting protein DprA [Saprospiraceae bacterium]|nr:DNA-protecting protein DprA [Saprospiraceae bacterium]
MYNENTLYQIALTQIENVGSATAKNLIRVCGSPQEIFKEKKWKLKKIPLLRSSALQNLSDPSVLHRAEKELQFAIKHGIRILYFENEDFPWRLKQQNDAPILLYAKGAFTTNPERAIAVVGTRNISEYGKRLIEEFIGALQHGPFQVVSGLAYGVDTAAHQMCVDMNIQTIGVLGHGLDRIYPFANLKLADKMQMNGGLVTEFCTGTKPDRENFPMRNRIIAGMCDALVVIETGESGGSMITAEIANSYNKDVFTYPGRIHDPYSKGCHKLVKEHKAQLITSAEDLIKAMNWDLEASQPKNVQLALFQEMNEDEKGLCEILQKFNTIHIDQLHQLSNMKPGNLASTLLSLEFKGLVRAHPGKRYTLEV